MSLAIIGTETFPYSIVDGALRWCETPRLKLELSRNLLVVGSDAGALTIVGKIHDDVRDAFDDGSYDHIDGKGVEMLTESDVKWAREKHLSIQDGLRMTVLIKTSIPREVSTISSVVPAVVPFIPPVGPPSAVVPPFPFIPSVAKSLTPAQAEVKRIVDVMFKSHMELSPDMETGGYLTLLAAAITHYVEVKKSGQ